ncbi:cell cycle checkpoint protein RAD17 [Cordyceps fumosorosea ARSEF 2679]|uniref:Cell cycle checkpoint protein RAD17 n=1 Tax=Cordyceps fumosorosea (strain ARSEF 2679) TaxID=1081104 RepID=A0A162LPN7_CORFA|nr:cell cycle checkpoint protein RAD17 [Cordyceps fumosorosea ARSEF 2679]OAA73824.1 cell cycle checkpoint protein RAD17 [Cordyceps fumosorosea ARSEF 2679]
MAPPAKRRRRNAVDSADNHDDDGDYDDGPPPSRANTLTNFLLSSPSSPTKTRIATASPSPSKGRGAAAAPSKNGTSGSPRKSSLSRNGSVGPSPRKTRAGVGRGSDEKGKSGDLKLLFSKQAQRASKAPSTGGDKRPPPIDDIISDPISEVDEISELKASSSSLVGQHARKRQRGSIQNGSFESTTSSQRFLKPPQLVNVDDDDLRPWSERFGPRNLDELAVHKKKVADVRRWLEEVVAGRMRQRLLILKGAAGSGKTTTVRLLAKEMGCELLEWRNPVGNAGTGFVSSSAQFQEFLGRGGKFGALDLDSPTPTSGNANMESDKRIMLIEEFPNTFSRSSSTLSSFRGALLQFLSNHVPSLSMFSQHGRREPVKPVILVISETLLTTTSASADSLTAHRLLGPEILGHPGVGVIEFNAIAPSLLSKALELVVLKEARKSGRRRTPGPMVLKRLGEIGDVRSAISSLEFLCLKGDQDADWGAKVAFTKQKKSTKDGINMTQGEQDSLQLISQREASLGIFHAVGKVVYNKREEKASGDDAEILPSYLAENSRPKKSQISVETLIGETGTDTHTFISALHENYILSCESTGPMDLSTPMDYVNECVEHLSLSDLMCPSSDVFFGGRGGFAGRDSGSHVLRQDEMMFEVAVRGMLFSLPNPVKRKTTGMARSSDAFKMFYPASLKLWRAKEEIGGLVDVWSSRLLKGEDQVATKELTAGANAFRHPPVLTAQSTQGSQMQPPKPQDSVAQDFSYMPMLSLGSAARRELLLERLPYMSHVARARKNGPRVRELEKIVSFSGVSGPNEEEDDDALDEETGTGTGEAWATDKPSEEASPRKKRQGIKSGAVTSMLAQKLVLSDDDIED